MDTDAAAHLRALAATQDGLVTLAQAIARGMRPAEIDSEIRAGRWTALLRGVYLLDPDRYAGGANERLWWRAALLAHGPNTCLAASSAVRAFGLHGLPLRQTTVEIAWVGGTPRARRRGDPQLCHSRVATPDIIVRQLPVTAEQVVTIGGFPVRRGDLTVIDAAGPQPPRDAQRP
jgi:hypothetical protein